VSAAGAMKRWQAGGERESGENLRHEKGPYSTKRQRERKEWLRNGLHIGENTGKLFENER